MSKSGTYAWNGKEVVKISDAVPELERGVYFNKGGVPYFDKVARRTFQSKQEKRAWLKSNGLREGGIINPDKIDQ
jgi:hypothetical protein